MIFPSEVGLPLSFFFLFLLANNDVGAFFLTEPLTVVFSFVEFFEAASAKRLLRLGATAGGVGFGACFC